MLPDAYWDATERGRWDPVLAEFRFGFFGMLEFLVILFWLEEEIRRWVT